MKIPSIHLTAFLHSIYSRAIRSFLLNIRTGMSSSHHTHFVCECATAFSPNFQPSRQLRLIPAQPSLHVMAFLLVSCVPPTVLSVWPVVIAIGKKIHFRRTCQRKPGMIYGNSTMASSVDWCHKRDLVNVYWSIDP